MPRPSRLPLAALALGLACAAAPPAQAGGKGRHVRYPADWDRYPSARYAAMRGDECLAELTRRGIEHTRVAEAPGVVTPLRLPRDVGGVVYRTEAPAHVRAAAPYDIFDCRLVLALSDFSKVLRLHDVDEVRLFSAYRPPPHRTPTVREGTAREASAPEHDQEEGTRHGGALAIDARRFGKRKGSDHVWLDVERDFHGTIGAVPCGPGAAPPRPATPEARELRSIVCEAADLHLFTSILTPTYDRAHRNHFHLEITPSVRWTLVAMGAPPTFPRSGLLATVGREPLPAVEFVLSSERRGSGAPASVRL